MAAATVSLSSVPSGCRCPSSPNIADQGATRHEYRDLDNALDAAEHAAATGEERHHVVRTPGPEFAPSRGAALA
jgi:hypothetical protein